MGTCTAFVFAALVEFTFVNYTWRTKGKLPGIPVFDNREYINGSQSNGDQNRNLLNLEEVILERSLQNVSSNLDGYRIRV